MKDRDRWGKLADRYASNGPRKILALDGGGIRALDREAVPTVPI